MRNIYIIEQKTNKSEGLVVGGRRLESFGDYVKKRARKRVS